MISDLLITLAKLNIAVAAAVLMAGAGAARCTVASGAGTRPARSSTW